VVFIVFSHIVEILEIICEESSGFIIFETPASANRYAKQFAESIKIT